MSDYYEELGKKTFSVVSFSLNTKTINLKKDDRLLALPKQIHTDTVCVRVWGHVV